MNKINRKLEYALMALKYMSQKIPGELTSAKEVSDAFHTPFDATARVMQQMAQKGGFLRAEYGASGGYQITKDLAKVSIHDLVEVIEGPTALVKCLHKEVPCEIQGTCNIVSPVTTLNNKLTDFYKSVSLKDLLVERTAMPKKSSEAVIHG
ncbi:MULTISPECIES: Rrf2 family transcriptional regulator [unclassified Bdellovibrio]|uniref:RrF2 family transcriptional regulator n=1 Tax=unclassified Bdellovibrio TaxID=2633795 RepID=UPI0011573246|nr:MULTISPECIES: Rrf2 family transcriptional regulator [unclassified Bdellovibrio]QDK43809.1 Rrf2 family transcriptional regulator [Bdellovibrio sp. ZAP7]QLY25631.1 Rrf2 family transcriptional regulator [Bdellovibrio sp. KM01]